MKKNNHKKVLITGGHITPALAVVDEIYRVYPRWDIICVGRATATDGHMLSRERELMQAKGVKFFNLNAGRFTRHFHWSTIVSLLKIPVGCIQALFYCLQEKPDIVVSFGGYVALPVALAAYTLKIPVITHEQTRVTGLSNRIIGIIAQKICVTFDDVTSYFPKHKVVVTGLPMRQELFQSPSRPKFVAQSKLPILYVTGGITGAVSLNNLFFPLVAKLVHHYTIVHQTGVISLETARSVKLNLAPGFQSRYIPQSHLDVSSVSWMLHNASLMIGRSGANTVIESATFGVPMLCIPLPWSAGGEQMANATWLKDIGLAEILSQDEVTEEIFIDMIDKSIHKLERLKDSKATRMRPMGAVNMVNEISGLLNA